MKKLLVLAFCFQFGVGVVNQSSAQPMDDIVDRKIMHERKILNYKLLREADIFWEKRIWRVIDVREKMNHTFSYPNDPFFSILQNAALNSDITLYSTESDRFEFPLDSVEVRGLFYSTDTIEIHDPVTYKITLKIIENWINWEDVKRFRIKEAWFFDENTGSMNVRILGIAPLIEVNDDNGNFRFEKPMFWAYYPEARPLLAKHEVFNPKNDAALISWEDLFEMRFFASYIFKQSNAQDLQLKHYLSGVDLLLEAEKIKQEIFNFEHDLWSY
jgi:gliding motility associated protien GldN